MSGKDEAQKLSPIPDGTDPLSSLASEEDVHNDMGQAAMEEGKPEAPQAVTRVKPKKPEEEEKAKTLWELICKDACNAGAKLDDKGRLVFDSKESARNFFKDQATEKKREFFSAEGNIVNGEFKKTGQYLVGCNGKFYEGNIDQIHKELSEALKQDKDNPNIKAALQTADSIRQSDKQQEKTGDMREKLNTERGAAGGLSALDDGDDDDMDMDKEAASKLGGMRS